MPFTPKDDLERSLGAVLKSIKPLDRGEIFVIPRSVDICTLQVTLECQRDGRQMIVSTSEYLARCIRSTIGKPLRATIRDGHVSSYYDPRFGRFQ